MYLIFMQFALPKTDKKILIGRTEKELEDFELRVVIVNLSLLWNHHMLDIQYKIRILVSTFKLHKKIYAAIVSG